MIFGRCELYQTLIPQQNTGHWLNKNDNTINKSLTHNWINEKKHRIRLQTKEENQPKPTTKNQRKLYENWVLDNLIGFQSTPNTIIIIISNNHGRRGEKNK